MNTVTPTPEITPSSVAAALYGKEYPLRPDKGLMAAAKAAGIVIVYGASDDLMEFDGAIYDEIGCCDGGAALIDTEGALPNWESASEDEEAAADYLARKAHARQIEAVWLPDGPNGATCWAYKTDIPHATFNIMEDGDVYCRGIVFALADLALSEEGRPA